MKRKTHLFLFAIISFIIFIVIFVGINEKKNNIENINTENKANVTVQENTTAENKANVTMQENTNTRTENNIQIEEDSDETIKFDAIAANIVLPPGSTSVDLQNAINSATSGDTIIISSDMQFSSHVENPIGKVITIQSDSENAWTLKQTTSSYHFIIRGGNLILQNIILDGATIGGGVYAPTYDSATFTMNIGAIIQNCNRSGVDCNATFIMNDGIIRNNVSPNQGGGVDSSGSFIMYGGIITGNTAPSGGGLYLYNATIYNGTITNNHATMRGGGIILPLGRPLIMYKGSISGNTSDQSGGGVYINGDFTMYDVNISENSSALRGGGATITGNLVMNGGNISKNTSGIGGGCYLERGSITINNGNVGENIADNGGGIYLGNSSRLYTRDEGISYIVNNTANVNGGGIYVTTEGRINPVAREGTCHITNNIAKANGGGIYTENITDYSNININNSTIFSKNIASIAYRPPDNATTLYPNIGFTSTSITKHPLNNYDINYVSEELKVNVSYNANGGTGSYVGPETTPGNTDTVLLLADTGISREEHAFMNWNSEADGSGTKYNPGDTITLSDDITLYAIWEVNKYTVIFKSNGGTVVDNQVVPYAETVTKPVDPIKQGYAFSGWYTDDGTFLNEWNFSTPVTKDITLYAKWIEDNYTVTFESNGGTPIEQQRVPFDLRVTKPDNPTKQGYTFSGWYTDNGTFKNEWDFNKVVTESMTLYAKWVADDHTVAFDTNGGTPIDNQTVPDGSLITKPTAPKKTGYIFDGWYTDNGTFENEWDFNAPVTEGITLYAKWKVDTNFNCIWIVIIIFIILILIIITVSCKKTKKTKKCCKKQKNKCC